LKIVNAYFRTLNLFMKTTPKYVVILLLLFSSITIVGNSQTLAQSKKLKNIILIEGDGTGLSQVSAAQFFKDGPSNYDRFPVIGLIKTSASSDLVTDSAAAATAFATGKKTYNGAIGVTPDSIPVPTLIEIVSEKGWKTGIVVTSTITHATPACFYAHVDNRNNHEEIASFLPTSDVDFFAGAGLKYFNERKDGLNLLKTFEEEGFTIETETLKDFEKAEKLGFLLAPESMPTMLQGRGNFLQEASELALKRLTNDNGFLLMVEGSQVDWGGHDNDADYVISELIDLDNTIGAILDFAEKDGETLVIVTADHETGGFTLAAKDGDYNSIVPTFSTKNHSATMVPVFAFGPGAENFGGIYENTEVFHKIMALLSE
jgi:alkaline phosphatase